MHNMKLKDYKKGELVKDILFIIGVGILVPLTLALPNLPLALSPLLKAFSNNKKRIKIQSVKKSLTYLKRERLIRVKKTKDGYELVLSGEGKRRVLKYNIDKLFINKTEKWDGFWRVVLFDIPENEKKGREALRYHLKKLGFYQLQKSCFIHPYECKNEIDFITEFFQISHYVNFILANRVEGTTQLKKFFDL